jgi:nitrogen-specific signal transduction histidine kinase
MSFVNTNPERTTTKVIHGTTNVVNAEVAFFSKTKDKADSYMNYTRPPLAVGLEPIKRAFLDAKNRGVRLRYISEITKDNLSYCKELMQIVHELRHLDGIKGNFMVSESEYLGPLILFEYGKIAPQAIYSNIKEIVEHQRYLFDNLWDKAIPAQERMKEIEEGRIVRYETKVLRSQDEITNKINEMLQTSDELLVCSSSGGLQLGYDKFLSLGKEISAKSRRGEHKGIRLVTTSIERNSIELLRILLELGIQIRDIKNIPPMNFSVTGKEVYATIDKMEGGRMVQSILASNEPNYVNHFRSIFEELWKSGIDAKVRIADIEQGIDFGEVEVIPNASNARERYLQMLNAATEEILLLFPTVNAFIRQEKIVKGSLSLSKSKTLQKSIKFRILMPFNQRIESKIRNFKHSFSKNVKIEVRYIESVMLATRATILVTDKEKSMVMEIKDDSKKTFDEAIGLSTYSNSRAGVLSYVSIFENLWKQIKLYENIKKSHKQLMTHNRMQQEFINIAAHELRTPIQPILGLTEIIRSKTSDSKQQQLLDITIRNAKRLGKLSAEILDVTKLESHTFDLKKEVFNLNDIIVNAVDDVVLSKEFSGKSIQLSYEPCDVLLNADKARIAEVISNLLGNAINFTPDGKIIISVERQNYKANNSNTERLAIVSVKDTGQGIDVSMLPRLFTKFASKSYQGTGLGLFISKGIIEAHCGKIWGENNDNGIGATFSFSLPAM